jgi:hypothetical protein
VTINPGRAYTDKASLKAAKDALTEKVDMIFGNLEEYLEVFKPAGNDFVRMNLTREQLDRLIVKGDVESHVEIGSKMHRLHTHCLVTLEHNPMVNMRLNVRKLRAVLGGGHLDVKFIKDHNLDLLRYIRKNSGDTVNEQVQSPVD